MQIALLNGYGSDVSYVASGPGGADWKFFNFRFAAAPDQLSFMCMPHSAFATPGRYLLEIARRMRTALPDTHLPMLLFNPMFQPDKAIISLVLALAGKQGVLQAPLIYCDVENRPVAYLFPPRALRDDLPGLSLLSATHAKLDRDLLALLLEQAVEIRRMPSLQIDIGLYNGFYGGPYLPLLEWFSENALRQLCHPISAGNQGIHAYMPHHAGDVLFFSLAVCATATSHLAGIAVNAAYLPIVRTIAPEFQATPLDLPAMNRGGTAMPEWDYCKLATGHLPADRCYYHARPVRDYDAVSLHLIDQYAFALGHPCLHPDELPSRQAAPNLASPPAASEGIRVLLHFDGGWPLKVYPRQQQEELVGLLQARGWEVSVLDGKHPLPCETTRFTDLASFQELLGRQHLLIGMDSFPVHYAAHVAGIPTICLFASTQPANSDAPGAATYLALERGLDCRPCRAISKCPRNGAPSCQNFVEPRQVDLAAAKLLEHFASQSGNRTTS